MREEQKTWLEKKPLVKRNLRPAYSHRNVNNNRRTNNAAVRIEFQ